MKIFYETTIMTRIYEAKREAERIQQKIEHIELSESEMCRLRSEICLVCYGSAVVMDSGKLVIYGIPVKVGSKPVANFRRYERPAIWDDFT